MVRVVEERNWMGRCRHLRWRTTGHAFNKPTDPPAAGWVQGQDYYTPDELILLLHGFTMVLRECETCGAVDSDQIPGRAQA